MKKLSLALLALAIFATPGFAKECTLEIEGYDKMAFNKKEMKVNAKECKTVTVVLKFVGKMKAAVMGHNWVLTKTEDMMNVATQGWGTSLEKHYLPEDRSKIIAATDIIGGGQTTKVTFPISKVKAGGNYSFFCSFPGHLSTMQGKFIVE